jgi:hypothetical protein
MLNRNTVLMSFLLLSESPQLGPVQGAMALPSIEEIGLAKEGAAPL